MDGIYRKRVVLPLKVRPKIRIVHIKALPNQEYVRSDTFVSRILRHQRLLAPVMAVVVLVAFAAGMNFAQQTPRTEAVEFTPGGTAANLGNAPTTTDMTNISNEVLFTTPLDMLASYLSAPAQPDTIAVRTDKLRQFLSDHNSPFVDSVDTLARQPHWKLILAISFAESTLGKKCYKFNCSGIGGSNLREYKSYANWMLDLNRLLENHYKNWTLNDMCGVYVKPCNPHWLLANQQILDELDKEEIK